MNRYVFLFFIIIPFMTGCAKLAHVTELLTLRDLSIDQDKQSAYVKKQNENFKKLLEAVETRSIDQYKNKAAFKAAFGAPIYSTTVIRDAYPQEKWLYCYATEVLKSERVYVYFDKKGQIIEWKYKEALNPAGPAL